MYKVLIERRYNKTQNGVLTLRTPFCSYSGEMSLLRRLAKSLRMRPLNIILIVVVAAMYACNQVFIKQHTSGLLQAFAICYLNDLMCPFLFLSYCNLLLLTINRELIRLPSILTLCLSAGLVWELAAPIVKKASVTDPVDLLCYLAGGAGYWLLLRTWRGGKR